MARCLKRKTNLVFFFEEARETCENKLKDVQFPRTYEFLEQIIGAEAYAYLTCMSDVITA